MHTESKEYLISKFSPYTMTDDNRLGFLYDELMRVIKQRIHGDFVEVGVWKGGNCLLAAELFRIYDQPRDVWLFDTFEGMPEPTEHDGKRAQRKYEQMKHANTGWCQASLEEVQENFAHFDLLEPNVHFVKGLIEKTWAHFPWRRGICVLREDTDFYSSTKVSLNSLYPEVSEGGTVIFDDYGKWEGQRKAVDEFLNIHGSIELQSIQGDKNLRYFRKPL